MMAALLATVASAMVASNPTSTCVQRQLDLQQQQLTNGTALLGRKRATTPARLWSTPGMGAAPHGRISWTWSGKAFGRAAPESLFASTATACGLPMTASRWMKATLAKQVMKAMKAKARAARVALTKGGIAEALATAAKANVRGVAATPVT